MQHALLIHVSRDGARAGVDQVALAWREGRTAGQLDVVEEAHAQRVDMQGAGHQCRQGARAVAVEPGHAGTHRTHRAATHRGTRRRPHLGQRVRNGLAAGRVGHLQATETGGLALRYQLATGVRQSPARARAANVQAQAKFG